MAKLRLALVVLMPLLYRIMSTSVKSTIAVPTTNRLQALRLQFMASEQAARIGARIRERREELGIETQRELADLIDVRTITNQVISNWERGTVKPGDENMRRLATALQVEQSYFYEEPEKESPDLMEVLSASARDEQLGRIEEKLDKLLSQLPGYDEKLDRLLEGLFVQGLEDAVEQDEQPENESEEDDDGSGETGAG
jgi:transcriptional regulator with XRE-family HTH domain